MKSLFTTATINMFMRRKKQKSNFLVGLFATTVTYNRDCESQLQLNYIRLD